MTAFRNFCLLAFCGCAPTLGAALAASQMGAAAATLAISLLSLCVYTAIAGVARSDGDFLNPTTFFSAFFGLYFVFPFGLMYFTDDRSLDTGVHVLALGAANLGLVAYWTGYNLLRPKANILGGAMRIRREYVLVVPAALIGAMPTLGSLGFGPAIVGFWVVFFSFVLLKEYREPLVRIYAVSATLFTLYLSLGEFTRAAIFQSILLALVFISVFHKKISIFVAAAVFSGGFVGLYVLAMARAIKLLPSQQRLSLLELLEKSGRTFELNTTNDSGLNIIARTLDFPFPYRGLLQVVEKVPDKVDYLVGFIYSKFFLVTVPRSLYPDKPEALAKIYPRHFISSEISNYSATPSIIGEFYWSMGWAGVVIGMCILGLMVRYIQEMRNRAADNYLILCVYASVILTIPNVIRGGVPNNVILVAVEKILPIVLILFVLALLSNSVSFGGRHCDQTAANKAR